MAETALMTVEGLEEAFTLLVQAPRVIVATTFLKAFQASGAVIEQTLAVLTPERSEGERSEGKPHLRDSLVTAITLDADYRGGFVEIGFGNMGYVANMVEYGHRMIGHRPERRQLRGKKTPDGMVQAQPFIRKAFEASADDAIDAFAQVLIDQVESSLGL